MGKIVEKKKKKKKGRPSLLDLQKRSLKQQQEQLQKQQKHQLGNKNHKIQNPTPNSSLRRSTRRNPNPDLGTDDEDRSSHKRREKKLKHVLQMSDDEGEAHSADENSGSDSNPDEDGSSGSNLRKRKINLIAPGSGLDNDDKSQNHRAATNQVTIQQGSKIDDGPSTPLPDKKLLLFILDRLQKKDTYGVFVEPVDPEELPDYHEVIKHPMDFGTVRKKLASDAYSNLEQFEKDVFLICSNAMQYNSPDTIYFRQARSIQELAKKNFENLRQDSDDNEPEPEPETEPKVPRRGRPPSKNSKRLPGRPPLEHANSNFSEAPLATTGGNSNRSSINVRKGPPVLDKQRSADLFPRSLYGSRYGETYIGWPAERYERSNDMTGSALKGISMKHGKKNIVLDESGRNTYKQMCALACRQEPSVLTTFDGERKLLIPVGLHTEYGYARSLSRFAAKLGPVAWKVASRKIERCLPVGVKFGPGWVGENETPAERLVHQDLPIDQSSPLASLPICGDSSSPPTKHMVESFCDKSAKKPQGEHLSEVPTSSSQSKLDNESKVPATSGAGNNVTPASSSFSIPCNGAGSKLNAPEASASSHPNTSNMLNGSVGALRAGLAYQVHQNPHNQSRINGLNGSYGLNFAAQMGKMIGAGRPSVNLQSSPSIVTVSRTETHSLGPPPGDNNSSGKAKLMENLSTIKPNDCSTIAVSHQKAGSRPPDLNVGFQSPGSPGSRRTDSVHPDLALQL